MKSWSHLFRLVWIGTLIIVIGVVTAQEDLSWVTDLLPTGDDIDINKQLEQGAVSITANNQVLDEAFNAANAWEETRDRNGNRGVNNQRYEMRLIQNDIIYTGLGTVEYDNVIITVDTERISTERNDGYGISCRATDEENGIHFYISSDGFWRIFAFVDGRARPFMPWTSSDLINQGENATNRITAVCVDDYFALYINGALVGEARDNTFSTGMVGMSVIVFEENTQVEIAFDNLRIWQAESAGDTSDVVTSTENNTDSNALVDDQRAATVLLLENGEAVVLNDLLVYDTLDSNERWTAIHLEEAEIEFEDDQVEMVSFQDATFPGTILSDEAYDNVVLQAEMTFGGGEENNAYGLLCRSGSNENGRGYYFNISAEGYFSVWVSDGNTFRILVNWERSTAINVSGTNQLTVACVDDYLAFYANDRLLVDLYNNLYLTGTVGVTVTAFDDDTEVSADNIFIWDAELP